VTALEALIYKSLLEHVPVGKMEDMIAGMEHGFTYLVPASEKDRKSWEKKRVGKMRRSPVPEPSNKPEKALAQLAKHFAERVQALMKEEVKDDQ
jgi:hypothetical protein